MEEFHSSYGNVFGFWIFVYRFRDMLKLMMKLTFQFLFLILVGFVFSACGEKDSVADKNAPSESDDAAAARKEMEEARKKGSGPAPILPPNKKKKASPKPSPEAKAPGGGDWPQWGRDSSNNMVSSATGIPMDFAPGEIGDDGKAEGAKHLKWVVSLGNLSYGTPTIYDGHVFVGTNNEEPRIESVEGDKGIVMCVSEKTGELEWQFSVPKLAAGKASDLEFLGICSSILLDGKYGYVVTNRGEVICLDINGMSDGNDGPFKDEAKYRNGGLAKLEKAEAAELDDKDADIVWGYDMPGDLGVFPHDITSSSVTIAGDYVFASTSNGVDFSHMKINIPSPDSPCLIALDKKTGKLIAEEGSGIGKEVLHCNWSSPAFAKLNGKDTVVFGAGDGWTYGFDAKSFSVEGEGDDQFTLLKELWKVDCNPTEYRKKEDGGDIKYTTFPGPSEIIASPVVADGKVYVVIGQEPGTGDGVGCLTCIDPTKGNGEEAVVWRFKEMGRSISTPSVADGLVYIADYAGRIFCLDAETGEKYWEHDTLSQIWASTLVLDGKVIIGTEDGELIFLKTGKEAEELGIVEFPDSLYSSVVVANGVLYVMTSGHLYAFGK